MHLLFSHLQFSFILPLALLVHRYPLYCTAIWEAFHFSLFSTMFYSYLLIYFASHMAHALPSAIICYLCAVDKDWKQLKLWERWYLLRIICQPFLFLGISNTQSEYFFISEQTAFYVIWPDEMGFRSLLEDCLVVGRNAWSRFSVNPSEPNDSNSSSSSL